MVKKDLCLEGSRTQKGPKKCISLLLFNSLTALDKLIRLKTVVVSQRL